MVTARPTLSAADSSRALALVCLFALGSSYNYTNHGPLFGLIAAEFRLSDGDAGRIASAFFAAQASTMLLGGVLADRVGARQVVSFGFLLVVISNLASGLLAPSYPFLLFWRAVGGLGAGMAFAAGSSYALRMAGPHGAHLAQGAYGAAFLLGSGITLPLMPLLAGEPADWRRAFVLSGICVAAAWAAWIGFAPSDLTSTSRARGSLRVALAARNTRLLALCHMAGFGLALVVSIWATAYLVRTFNLGLAQAGAYGSLLLAAGFVSRLLGGLLVERGTGAVALIRGSLALAAFGLLLMAVPGAPLALAVGGLLVTGVGVGLPYAAVFNGAAASVPSSPASAQALVGWAALLITMAGPPLVGWLLDISGSFSAGLALLAALALTALIATRWLEPFDLESQRGRGVGGSAAR